MSDKQRILVVDEDENDRLAASIVLEQRYDVTVVRSARDAIKRLRVEWFDAVISEIDLPLMNGFALADWMRVKLPDIPCVLVTEQLERHADEIQRRGVMAMQRSPFPLDLLRAVAIALAAARREPMLDPALGF